MMGSLTLHQRNKKKGPLKMFKSQNVFQYIGSIHTQLHWKSNVQYSNAINVYNRLEVLMKVML